MNDGYGEIKFRAQHGAIVFEEFKNARGAGRWRDGFSSYLDKLLTENSVFEAAQKVRAGWMVQVQGLGFVTCDPLKVPGGTGSTHASDLLEAYTRWYKDVTAQHGAKAVLMCLEVLCHGHTLHEVDQKRQQRNGKASENLITVLAMY